MLVVCLVFAQEEAAASGRPIDPRPTIVFTTIDHPIMREWALPGVDVEVFPSGLVLEEMDSTAVRAASRGVGSPRRFTGVH